MKEWQGLLNYINLYVYDEAEEEIMVKHGPDAEAAYREYEKCLGLLDLETVEEVGGVELIQCILGLNDGFKENTEKWAFDIAIDCVRGLDQDGRKRLQTIMSQSEYHMNYGMWIRNRYIHPAQKHNKGMADDISYSVLEKIFSILSPVYDFRDPMLTTFFNSSNTCRLTDLYEDRCPEIFDCVIQRLQAKVFHSATEAIDCLKTELRNTLGMDEFVRLLKEALKEAEDQKDREEWFWKWNFPSVKALLYPLETKQMDALRKQGMLSSIQSGTIKGVAECRKYIDQNLGLRDDYADNMADVLWRACNPVDDGTWLAKAPSQIDI